MIACEKAIAEAGFRTVEIVATLAGSEPLYATFGYEVVERSADIVRWRKILCFACSSRMTKSMEIKT